MVFSELSQVAAMPTLLFLSTLSYLSLTGELYFLATSYPSAYLPHGSIYKFVDPSRRAPPGKCKYKAVPVKTRSKRVRFRPLAKIVLDLLKEQSEKAARKLSNATSASWPVGSSSLKGPSRKPASPTSSRKTFRGPGTKKRARVWSPGSQGKRKMRRKSHSGRVRQSRASRSLRRPFLSGWLAGERARGESPRPTGAPAAELGL